jgi:hypothetical protein
MTLVSDSTKKNLSMGIFTTKKYLQLRNLQQFLELLQILRTSKRNVMFVKDDEQA